MTTPTKMNTSRTYTISASLALAITAALLTPTSTHAITRVKVAPEVGRHIFQLDLGTSGSIEEDAADIGFAWSAAWTYHADNSLGLGITVGRNKPESNFSAINSTFLDYDFSYVAATIHVRAPTRGAFIPRLQAGFGKYSLNINQFDRATSSKLVSVDVDDFGMFYGFGVDYLIAPHLSLGVVANYHFISVNDSDIGVGEWYDTWDLKAVITIYTR